MDDVEEKPFAVDRAKTGRAGCKRCKGKLETGSLRLARLVANPFSESGSKMKAWHHVQCLFDALAKARASTRKIEDPAEDIEGWESISQDDQAEIERHLAEVANRPGPKQKTKAPANNKESPAKNKKSPAKSPTQLDTPGTSGTAASVDENHRDNSFRQFRTICAKISDKPAYSDKTAIVKNFLREGSSGDGFHGDVGLWMRLLLPGASKRVYNLQGKQIVKLFSKIFKEDLEEMTLDLADRGDVASTIKVFFERTQLPSSHATLSIQQVEDFLIRLSKVRSEDEQTAAFETIVKKCTPNDLQMILRLIMHDLRINAGAAHILEGLHESAYDAFKKSRDLDAVVARVLGLQKGGKMDTGIAVMTPIQPMLAEVCKSVDQAMTRCPNGIYSEVKYDGERVQVHKQGSNFSYFSRSLKPVVQHKVSHLAEFIPKAFPHGRDLILDSEVLLIDTQTDKPLPFGTLGVHKKAEFQHASVCLFVFDCLYYNGEVLLDRPLIERRKILKENMTEVKHHVVFSEIKEILDKRDLEKMIARVLSEGLEGLVIKDIKSVYEPGKRRWCKIKKDYLAGGKMADTADLVPLGAWFGTGNKGGMKSIFLMCCWDPARQRWLSVTKVHGGFDDKQLENLQTELEMERVDKDPDKVPSWLKLTKQHVPDFLATDPTMMPVWEITGAEFTRHNVHTAGISVRFPRVTRQRPDKTYKEATNLPELKTLYENSRHGTDVASLFASTSSDSSQTSSPSKRSGQPKKGSPNKKLKQVTGSMDKFVQRSPPRVISPAASASAPAPKPIVTSQPPVQKPLPEVFSGVRLHLPGTCSTRCEQLKRYFIAYGGELLSDTDEGATHLIVEQTNKSKNDTTACPVRVTWIWDSLRAEKLLPTERYKPSL